MGHADMSLCTSLQTRLQVTTASGKYQTVSPPVEYRRKNDYSLMVENLADKKKEDVSLSIKENRHRCIDPLIV